MNVCFIMYPWHEMSTENDSTLAMIQAFVKRGHGLAAENTYENFAFAENRNTNSKLDFILDNLK